MENSGDKFASLLIPNCHRIASQEEKLQSCPFARESKVLLDDIQSSSSMDDSTEQATGIEMVSLPDSFEDHQTPPEQPSYSHMSSNDGHVEAKMTAAFGGDMESGRVGKGVATAVDDDGEPQGQRIVDLANESDNLDTEQMDVDDRVDEIDAAKSAIEALDTEVMSSPEDSAHQVFVEMPQREQQTSNREKRKLSFIVKTQKRNSNNYKHDAFKNTLNRVLKIVEERKRRDGGDDVDIDFLETATKRGLIVPSPRWWPAEGFKD